MPELIETAPPLRVLDGILLWSWELPVRVDPGDVALLGDAERARLRHFKDEPAAAAYTRTRAEARRALGLLLGVPAGEVALGREPCPGCGDPRHGPPRLVSPDAPLAISLSRTTGRGLLAVSTVGRVGVDVEVARPVVDETVARLALTDREREAVRPVPAGTGRDLLFMRAWTRKEAVTKAVGTGLVGIELNRLDTHPHDPGPVLVTHERQGRTTVWAVANPDVGEGYVAAVAAPGQPMSQETDTNPYTSRDEESS